MGLRNPIADCGGGHNNATDFAASKTSRATWLTR